MSQERVEWKKRLKAKSRREMIARKLAILDSSATVIREIFEACSECQRHDKDKTPQENSCEDYKEIEKAIQTFNPHSPHFENENYGAIAHSMMQEELVRTTGLLIPAHVEVMKGLITDIKAMNAANDNTHQRQMRASAQSLETQDKAVTHGEKLQKALNDEEVPSHTLIQTMSTLPRLRVSQHVVRQMGKNPEMARSLRAHAGYLFPELFIWFYIKDISYRILEFQDFHIQILNAIKPGDYGKQINVQAPARYGQDDDCQPAYPYLADLLQGLRSGDGQTAGGVHPHRRSKRAHGTATHNRNPPST